MSVQRGLPFTRRWLLCSQELLLRTWRRPINDSDGTGSPSAAAARPRSATNIAGRKVDAPIRRRDTTRKRSLERTEVDAVRRVEQALHGQAHRTAIGRAHQLAQGTEARQRAQQLHLPGIRHAVAPRLEHPVERAVRTETPRHRIFHLAATRAPTRNPAPCAGAAQSARGSRDRAASPRASRTVAANTWRRCAPRSRSTRCRSDCAPADSSAAGSGVHAATTRSGTGRSTP